MVLDDEKFFTVQLPRLQCASARRGEWPLEAVRGTEADTIVGESLEVSTANVEDGIDEQIEVLGAEVSETDVLGVPQQPGGLVIGGARALLQGADPERHRDFLALRAKGGAGRGGVHCGNLVARGPSPPFKGRALCS
jgi:hypothetical protein